MFDKNETYFYGTLLELAREQLISWDKHQRGKLGMWGRARASSRNGAIDKFVQKLIDHKVARGIADPVANIVEDLEFIQRDSSVWDDISDDQLNFLRKLLIGE